LRRVHAAAPIPLRNRWAGRFTCLGRSMLAAAALWMLAYLWLMPTVVQRGEADYQTQMALLERPREYIAALNKTMAEIRADRSSWKPTSPSEAKKTER
jgi:hypothetical protein